MKRTINGFTLVELVVTIVILIVLMSISVPIYNINQTKAKMAEGYALLATIRSAQEQYFVEWGNFLADSRGNGSTVNDDVLKVNARTNNYFKYFNIHYQQSYSFCNIAYGFAAWCSTGSTYGADRLLLVYNLTTGVTFKDWKYPY